VRRAVAVNDAGSLTAAGQIGINFVPEYHRVQLHSIHTLRGPEALDRTNSPTRFLQRERSLERGVYSGEVTASVLVSDLRVGDTLVYAYSIVGQNPIFGGKFIDIERWDQGFRTVQRRLAVSHALDKRIAWRLIGDGQVKPVTPTESTDNGMRKLVFEERSMQRIDAESNTPPNYYVLRWLQFSEFSDWEGAANWANELFQVREVVSEEFRSLVAPDLPAPFARPDRRLCRGCVTPLRTSSTIFARCTSVSRGNFCSQCVALGTLSVTGWVAPLRRRI